MIPDLVTQLWRDDCTVCCEICALKCVFFSPDVWKRRPGLFQLDHSYLCGHVLLWGSQRLHHCCLQVRVSHVLFSVWDNWWVHLRPYSIHGY